MTFPIFHLAYMLLPVSECYCRLVFRFFIFFSLQQCKIMLQCIAHLLYLMIGTLHI